MFSKSAIDQIKKLLQRAQNHDYRGLIIDLRNNSGGLLDAVVEIASFFVPKNSLVAFTKDKDGKTIEEYHTAQPPIITRSMPIFVLINNYTASAAEILAGCLQMHSEKQEPTHKNKYGLQVFLVGTDTYGKGSVQEIIPVSNNSAVKLTTYLYYLPNGETIQGIGIKPDFFIEKEFPPSKQIEWLTKYYGRESSHKNSIKTCTQDDDKKDESSSAKASDFAKATSDKTADKSSNYDDDKPKRWQERAKEMLQKDNQLRATITLINMLHFAQKCCPKEVASRADAVGHLKEIYLDHNAITIEDSN
jgi:C-terminal processing protease CtpA/Prc